MGIVGCTWLGSASGSVQGNRIGVDESGMYDTGNALEGIFLDSGAFTIGGTGQGEGNIISGNGGNGITVYSDDHVIKGNSIGTGNGGGGIPNGGNGIRLGGSQAADGAYRVSIGAGTGQTGANTIAHNVANGIQIDGNGSLLNQIRINSIYSNGGLWDNLTNAGKRRGAATGDPELRGEHSVW